MAKKLPTWRIDDTSFDARQGDILAGKSDDSSLPAGRSGGRWRSAFSTGHRLWQERWLYLLLIPGALYFLVFYYVPLLGNIAAFQNYSPYLGFLRSPWVGFANFISIFTDPDILTVTINTLIISLLQIIFAFPVSIILALMLNELAGERFKRFLQNIFYLPHFVGWVVIISIWQEVFSGDGFINHLLVRVGGHAIDFLSNPDLFKPMIVLQVIWKESGWGTVIFLAAMAGVNLSLYEAAAIDGASRWGRLWHITLPGIRGVIILLLILRLGNVLTVGFEQIFLQMNGQTLAAAGIIDTYVYQQGIGSGQWGYAAAVALLKAVIGTLIVYIANKSVKKLGEEGLF